jgi:hypothetical protein
LRSAHISSASATDLPSTVARHWNRPMLRIMRLSSTSSMSWSPGPTIRVNFALSTFTR